MALTAEEKRILKNQREKQNYQDLNKELEKLGKQFPNPTGAKLSKLETLKLANNYLESLKMMLNGKVDIKVEPTTPGPRKIKVEPKTIKHERIKSIKREIRDYEEQAGYGSGEIYDETSDPERFFRELDHHLDISGRRHQF